MRSDADDRVRQQAIRELATLAPDSSQEIFSQALEDPSPRVRQEAERALRQRASRKPRLYLSSRPAGQTRSSSSPLPPSR
jgi:HEAT repeat protein